MRFAKLPICKCKIQTNLSLKINKIKRMESLCGIRYFKRFLGNNGCIRSSWGHLYALTRDNDCIWENQLLVYTHARSARCNTIIILSITVTQELIGFLWAFSRCDQEIAPTVSLLVSIFNEWKKERDIPVRYYHNWARSWCRKAIQS